MNKVYLLVGLMMSALLFNACTKSYYRDGTTTKPAFIVNGVEDVTVSDNRMVYYMRINVDYNTGQQESIKLSMEGLPPGITAIFSATSGYPPLFSNLAIRDSLAQPGTYLTKLVVVGSISGRKEYPITITVEEVPDCSLPLAGNYSANSNCASSMNYTETITTDLLIKRRIHLKNFENLGIDIYGTVDCPNYSISVPTQTVGIYTIMGSGAFIYDPSTNTTRVYISYQKTTAGGGSNGCYIDMTK